MEREAMNEELSVTNVELSRQSLIRHIVFGRWLRPLCAGAVFLVARDKPTRIFLYKREKGAEPRIDRLVLPLAPATPLRL